MKIERPGMVAEAAAGFLAADGFLNSDALASLNKQLLEALKKANKTAEKEIKALSVFVKSRRAKAVKYSAASEKKGDLKYRVRRAFKIAERKRMTEKAHGRVEVILTVVPKEILSKALATRLKEAQAAIKKHSGKIEKTLAGIKKIKEKTKEGDNKVFMQSVKLLTDLLDKSGHKEKDRVIGKTMFGTSVFVRLGADNYITIGKSDAAKFKAAQKALTEAPATPAKAPASKKRPA